MDIPDLQQRFGEFFRLSQAPLRAFVLAVTRDEHRCDDILQEVSVVLWRRFADFDPTRPFLAWARGIAANCILKDGERRRRALPALSPEAIACIAQAESGADDGPSPRAEALRRCLSALGERSRRLLALRYERGLGIEDLAKAVDTSVAAARKSLYRVRSKLLVCVHARLQRQDRA
jgi:RNA polymerase sigma-70 factor (ECF subfamily)